MLICVYKHLIGCRRLGFVRFITRTKGNENNRDREKQIVKDYYYSLRGIFIIISEHFARNIY